MQESSPTSKDLVELIIAGELDAWPKLQSRIAPSIERWIRSHAQMRARKLCGEDSDHVRNVLVAALERLARRDFRNLHSFALAAAQRPQASFESWLYVLVDYAVQDYLRDLYGPSPLSAEGRASATHAGQGGPNRRDVNSHAARLDFEDDCLERVSGITTKLTAQQIMEHVQKLFSERELACLRAYIVFGNTYDEIADDLGLRDAKQAQDMIRALKERLRVMFRDT